MQLVEALRNFQFAFRYFVVVVAAATEMARYFDLTPALEIQLTVMFFIPYALPVVAVILMLLTGGHVLALGIMKLTAENTIGRFLSVGFPITLIVFGSLTILAAFPVILLSSRDKIRPAKWSLLALVALIFASLVLRAMLLERSYNGKANIVQEWKTTWHNEPKTLFDLERQNQCCGLETVIQYAWPPYKHGKHEHACNSTRELGYQRACLTVLQNNYNRDIAEMLSTLLMLDLFTWIALICCFSYLWQLPEDLATYESAIIEQERLLGNALPGSLARSKQMKTRIVEA